MLIKGEHLLWSEVPMPVLGDEDVLIKVAYAAVNRADLMQREGLYPPPPGCPDWPGLEVSGEIVSVGENVGGRRNVGDKVCALLGGGGYAEFVAVRFDMTLPLPPGVGLEKAAAMPEAFATAYLNLCIEGGIKKGDVVLMNAGASGLASVVIPMAKAFGAFVITTIIDENKRETVEKTGADLIVNTEKEDITEIMAQFDREGRPVNIAIDCLGGAVMGKCLPYMAYMGKWIMIATLAGDFSEVDMRKLYIRNVRLVGSTLRSKPESVKAEIMKSLYENMWDKAASGEVAPHIHAVLPIERAEEAHSLLYGNKSAGKVVLKIG